MSVSKQVMPGRCIYLTAMTTVAPARCSLLLQKICSGYHSWEERNKLQEERGSPIRLLGSLKRWIGRGLVEGKMSPVKKQEIRRR
jgi:hypothetical protein